MFLEEIEKISKNIKIKKDGEYDTLGLITNKYHDKKVLVFINNKNALEEFKNNPSVSCVICTEEIAKEIENKYDVGICIDENPKELFFKFHNYLVDNTDFYGKRFKNEISKTAYIHPSVAIGDSNIKIGDGTVIEPNVTILNNVEIGNNVKIRAGAVIGGEGFQFIRKDNSVFKVKSAGKVIIHDNVEILANTCIERGVLGGATEIGEFTKIDHLVLVGHDTIIGKRCFIVGCAMISGRVTIGDDVWVGPNSTIANGIQIGNRAKITMGAVVTKNVEEDEVVTGNFAIKHDRFIEFIKSIR